VKGKRIMLVAVVALALGTGLILLHQLKGAEPTGAPGEPAGARGGVQKAASGPGAGTQPASAPAFDANDPDVKLLVKGLNEFAIDMYKEIAKTEKGNIFFSPFSISSALAMTYAGARGKTAEEMAKVLHFPPELLKDDAKRLHAAFGKLIGHQNAEKGPGGKPRGYELVTANALWGQAGYPFLEGFIRSNRDYYGASIELVDFARGKEKAVQNINEWVAKETRRNIPKVMDPSELKDETRLVLTNAIYFKGDWAEKFNKALTRDGVFHLASREDAKVPFMNRKGAARFFPPTRLGDLLESRSDCVVQFLELPYAGKEVSMVLCLPEEEQGLAGLEKSLSRRLLEICIPQWGMDIEIAIPKVALTFGVELSKTLSGMGLSGCFVDADFSGMDGTRNLSMSKVFHKALVEVNEEGTVAAAGSAASVVLVLNDRPRFAADHPFLFAIVDRGNGCILFLGRVLDPR